MPRYSKKSLEQLREKIDLVDLLSANMNLKRTGAVYKGLCPFHEEKTPSFMVKSGDTHYHCFGCGAHGDAIQFLMGYLRLSFGDAVEMLAQRFHVPLEIENADDGPQVNKTLLKEVLQTASEFFHCYLLYTEEGHHALDYLFQRKFSLDFIRRFEIGLAPKTPGLLRKVLHAKNFTDQNLLDAGLLSEERKHEFFRDRITFPICNAMGAVIGFSARKYREETTGGKYINSPETPVFKKSRILFGLNHSRRRIAKEQKAILVEGQIDCLRMIEAGLDYTVAPLGTAFGENLVKELQNLGAKNIFILFDPDDAGETAASKAGDFLQKAGMEVFVVTLPQGKDPDLFLLEFGAEKLKEKMDEKCDYLTFQVRYLSKKCSPTSPAGKAELVKTLTHQIREWQDPVLIHESLRKVAFLLQVPEETIGMTPGRPSGFFKPAHLSERQLIDPHRVLELDLLRWQMLMGSEKPELIELIQKYLKPTHFLVPICRKLFESYFQAFEAKKACDLLSLLIEMDDPEGEACLEEILQKRINRNQAEACILETIQKILDRQWMQRCEEIKMKIHSGNHSEDEVLAFAKEFDSLKKERPQVRGKTSPVL